MVKNTEKQKIGVNDLINIQKLVFLLDDWHYQEFLKHLTKVNAMTPVKLIESIKRKLPEFANHEELCTDVYGDYSPDSRLSFNQLSAYTFRLSEFLAVNYPAYLSHNIQKLQALVAADRGEEANFIAEVLLSFAQKVEDFNTQMVVLKFLTQQELLFKRLNKAVSYNQLLTEALENERLSNEILYIIRKDFNISLLSEKKTPKEVADAIAHFESYHNHSSKLISLLSQYAVLYIIFYFRPDILTSKEVKDKIEEFEKVLKNYSYLIFTYLFDIRTILYFIKINSPHFKINAREGISEISKFKKHFAMVKYWHTYLNIPELYIVISKASFYLGNYTYLVHRKKYSSLLPNKTQAEIEEIVKDCKDLLAKHSSKEEYLKDMINLRVIYSGMMIILGGENIHKGLDELESTLVEYQQINKSGSIDSSFALLMIGYFASANYKKCLLTYSRYIKVAKNKHIYEENDLYIQLYYNVARWMLEHKEEYIKKIEEVYERTIKNNSFSFVKTTAEELVQYFAIPVSTIQEKS